VKKRVVEYVDNNVAYNNLPLLPPTLAILESNKILKQLVNSSVVLAELKGMVNILPNPNILLNAAILKEASASSEIENVITTQDKLYTALSANGVQIDSATKEVLRYREALLYGMTFIKKNGFLTINAIIEIQRRLEDNNAGLRKLPGTALRSSKTGKVVYTPPDNIDDILRLLGNFEKYINERDEVPYLIKMAVQHYQFESIHPFYDGNGRTGRIINILYLIMSGLIEKPVVYLSGYVIENKAEYYNLLQEVRTKNNWEGWVLYILKGVEFASRMALRQVISINKLLEKTKDKVQKRLPKMYSIELVELLFEQPYCKSEFLENRLSISRITAAKYLKELEKIKVLKSQKAWKETLYVNTELFELLRK
jgi:Fic family protein